MSDKKNIATIGGGTGQYQLLRGLSGLEREDLDLTSIVSMMDNGGSSGVLRDEYGVLPPGDFMRCVLALSPMTELRRRIFLHRFNSGDTLSNLIYTAAREELGDDSNAIEYLNVTYNVQGQVLPITVDNVHLKAELSDGQIINGETNIDIRKVSSDAPIMNVWLEPEANIFYKSADAIVNADLIIFGPGDLYTSIIPNVLVRGFKESVEESDARKLFITNLFTKKGETDDYKALDFVNELERYLGKNQITDILIHNNGYGPEVIKKYEQEEAFPVQFCVERLESRGFSVRVEDIATKKIPIRHDSSRLGEIIAEYL